MEDANDWRELIKFPDVNSWDWEGHAHGSDEWFEKNKDLDISAMLLNGMGFENAAMALIDEDQVDAVRELAMEFCEFFIRDGKCRTLANCMRKNPKFVAYVYQISRQMLNP